MAQRQRLLAVHVLAGRERLPTDVRVRLRRSQIDDQLDGVICEQLVEVRVDAAAELGDKALGRPRVDVGRSDELEPVDGTDPVGVARRDVAAADDPDPHPSHPSSCSRIARHSSLGSWSFGSCSTVYAPP